MAKKYEIGVIGLGRLGFRLAQTLVDLGHKAVGVDINPARIKRAQEVLSQVYVADATDKTAMQQLGMAEFSHVVVSIGSSMEASILATLTLKELGVPQVWVKALSEQHETILLKLGADHVLFPESLVAQQLAHRLVIPGLTNYLGMGKSIALQERDAKQWAGQTLRELNFTNLHNILVVAIKGKGDSELTFIPSADTMLNEDDTLVIIGKEKDLSSL